jgi:riboflavin transporter FmnP
LKYEIWEIPILASLLIFGGWVGVMVAVLNTGTLEVIQPGALPTGPIYNLIAVLSMILGVVLAHRALSSRKKGIVAMGVAATSLGALIRVVVMTGVNYLALPQPYPIGFSIPLQAVPGILVLTAIFNATLALYTVPVSYGIVKAITSRYRLTVAYPIVQTGLAAPST